MKSDEVIAAILLQREVERLQRKERWTRRGKKAGLLLAMPLLGPLAGDEWAKQESKGWK